MAPMTDPGAMLATVHELPDGERLRLRLTRPSDAPRVRAFLERLSPEARERRFLTQIPEVRESTVRHFTFYDPRERLTVAATIWSDGVEEMVGLADIALLGTGLAEIGLVVDEGMQGRGLGTLLAEAIASLALARGATHLKATMAASNQPMLSVLEHLGRTVRTVEQGTSVAYTRLGGTGRRPRAA